jgi:plastocyanin
MKLAGVAILIGVVLSTLAVGCSSGTSNTDRTATAAAKGGANPTTVATKASSGSPASGGTRKQLTITARDFSFSADAVNVAKGDTIGITFKNSGSATHTLTFYSDAAYANAIAGGDTGSVSAGATTTLTVTADVGLFYRCNIHPAQMQGQIDFK